MVLVCGGSSGLGAAVAKQLAARGAHITIFARSQDRLDSATKEIKANASTKDQEIAAVAVDLGNAEEVSIGCRLHWSQQGEAHCWNRSKRHSARSLESQTNCTAAPEGTMQRMVSLLTSKPANLTAA